MSLARGTQDPKLNGAYDVHHMSIGKDKKWVKLTVVPTLTHQMHNFKYFSNEVAFENE
jgi:hypothetical protein